MKENMTGLLVTVVLVSLLTGAVLSYVAFPNIVEKEVIVYKGIDVQYYTPPYNDTGLKADIAAVKAEVLKDSDWEEAAKVLAIADMKERNYKNVYNALVDLNMSIKDKEDVSSVIIKDSDVTDFDVDEKDATVVLDLKVYYENSDGDDKKAYLTLETEIIDNEVDDTIYELS